MADDHADGCLMKSYSLRVEGTRVVLQMGDAPKPEPGPGQVLLRMLAAGLNRGEFLLGHGLHGKPGTWKAIGGEGAGEVSAVGPEVTGFRAGDRVMRASVWRPAI